jgi:hypothetical protein
MKKLAFVSLFVVLGIAPGCAHDDSSDGEDVADLEEQTEMVNDTIVRVNEDGTETVTVRWLTRAERRAENEARERLLAAKDQPGEEQVGEAKAALVVDSGCSELWLNDEPNQEGNRICFRKAGPTILDYVYLGNYCRERNYFTGFCWSWWDNAVQSYWSWTDPVYFFTACPSIIESSGSYEQVDTVNSCVAQATHVGLGYLAP